VRARISKAVRDLARLSNFLACKDVPSRWQSALGALQRADAEKWWPIIKELGIKPE
jgi:hypothetical protein